MLRSIFNFCFLRIDQSIMHCNWQKYQEGRTQVLKCPRGEEGKGREGGRNLLLVYASLIYRAYLASTGMSCWTGCGYLSKRLLTISLFSAFNIVSLEKSMKVGKERSTCAVSTIKFHDVNFNWWPRRHNPTQTSLHAPPPPYLPLRGVHLKRIW